MLSASGDQATLGPALPAPTPGTAQHRDKAIRLTVVASAAAKASSIVCTFVQVPIALHYLGTEAYGFWITLFSVIIVLNSVDFGIGVGMQHAMATYYGNDDDESIRRIFWTGVLCLCGLGLAVLAVGIPLTLRYPWAQTLHIHDPALRESVKPGLCIALLAFVTGLPFNAVARLAAAIQRGWIHAGWIAAGSAISLALVAAASVFRWGLLGFLAATLFVPAIQGLGLAVHLLWRLGWSFVPSALAPAAEVRSMLRSSFTFALPQIGQVLVQSLPPLALSAAAGTAAVTAYNLLLRLYSPFQQGQLLHLAPVWPAYTEAHERQDHVWIERTFRRTLLAFAALAGGLAAAAWQSRRLLSIWVGAAAADTTAVYAWPVALWCILLMAAQPGIYSLIGTGQLKRLAAAATPGFLAASAALFFGIRFGGLTGVLGAGSVCLGLGVLPPVAWLSMRSILRPRLVARSA